MDNTSQVLCVCHTGIFDPWPNASPRRYFTLEIAIGLSFLFFSFSIFQYALSVFVR